MAQDRITKLDDATVPAGNGDAIKKYVGMAFATILTFGLVVLGVAYVEFQARKVNSIHEVNDGLGIRVIGELPNVSGRTWKRLKGGKGPAVLKALMAERIDATRTALIHTTAADAPRVVMITSAEPHEGKTTTASSIRRQSGSFRPAHAVDRRRHSQCRHASRLRLAAGAGPVRAVAGRGRPRRRDSSDQGRQSVALAGRPLRLAQRASPVHQPVRFRDRRPVRAIRLPRDRFRAGAESRPIRCSWASTSTWPSSRCCAT